MAIPIQHVRDSAKEVFLKEKPGASPEVAWESGYLRAFISFESRIAEAAASIRKVVNKKDKAAVEKIFIKAFPYIFGDEVIY